ncbi:hypothetical protein BH23ACT4_BH23ACT4_06400 [soil metagenome]
MSWVNAHDMPLLQLRAYCQVIFRRVKSDDRTSCNIYLSSPRGGPVGPVGLSEF